MKRTVGLALIGAALLATAFAPLPVGRPFTIKSFSAQLAGATGLAADIDRTDVTFTLLPFPKARFHNVRLIDRDGATLAQIGSLDAFLRPLDLVGGRLRFSGMTIADARFEAATPEARASWRRAGQRLLDRDAIASTPAPGQTLILRSAVAVGPDVVTDLNARIAWHGGDEPLSLWATARWKGEEAEARLSDFRVSDFLSGAAATPLRVSARTPFATLDGSATVIGGAAPGGEAKLRLAMRSAANLARWLETPVPLAGIIDQYEFEGQGAFSNRGFTASAASFSAGGSRFEGTLALRSDGARPLISGTLAAQAVDIDRLTTPIDRVSAAPGRWSDNPFEPTPLRQTDLDLRISATGVKMLGAQLREAAMSLIMTGGRLELVLGRAQAYDGAVRGRASLHSLDDDRIDARLQATFDNVDFGAAFQDIAGRRLLTGLAQGAVQLEATGASPSDLARRLAGKVSLKLRDGDIAGVSLTEAARRPASLLEGAMALGRGRTSFSALDLAATLNDGVAQQSELTLAGGGAKARMGGEISIRDQALWLNGIANAPGLPADGMPFTLRGPWRRPDLRWDPLTAFRRS